MQVTMFVASVDAA